MPAVRAAHPREAVGEDAAAQIASKVALHPPGDAPAHGVGFLRLGEEGLEVMLDHRVQGRLGGTAGAIDGTGWAIRRRCDGGRPSAGGMGRGWGMRGHVPTHRKSVCCAMAGSAIGRRLTRWGGSRSPTVMVRVVEGPIGHSSSERYNALEFCCAARQVTSAAYLLALPRQQQFPVRERHEQLRGSLPFPDGIGEKP